MTEKLAADPDKSQWVKPRLKCRAFLLWRQYKMDTGKKMFITKRK